MRKIVILFSGLFLIMQMINSQIINKTPLSERITSYKIDARLDPATKTVAGSMDAFWVNNSSDTVPDVMMHMYMNAFRDNMSTFFMERGGSPSDFNSSPGWIEIKSFTDRNGFDLTRTMNFISPDDGNTADKTVLRVILPDGVLPGDTAFVKIDFETKLPSRIRRTGYNKDFYFVAQWFPKFGVYESAGMRYATKGGWNCHQFHANSEFYSNHSVYEVDITLPSEYIVGSCGMLIAETETNSSIKTLSYRAEDIVDFAWTAWPGFEVLSNKWKNVDIKLLIPFDKIKHAERHFRAVKFALEYLNDNVGPYPWPYLTIIDPPAIGEGAGGMEYTTLFTTASSYLMPDFYYEPESVTVHEFIHAYFMGTIASNEFEEPWLDEGFTSFWEMRVMDHYYGNSGLINHPLLKVPYKTYRRLPYINSQEKQLVTNSEYSWNYPLDTYHMMSYVKVTVIMHTLMGLVGEETMNDIFREYYKSWAFKHPSGKDFINVVNDVVRENHGDKFGPDLNRFFDQTLFGTGICDYSVVSIRNAKHSKPAGKTEADELMNSSFSNTDSLYTSVAGLHRTGDIILPVEVLIHFTDGEEIIEEWDGESRYKEFSYSGSKKIQWVKIDPEGKISLDINMINNSKTLEPDHLPLNRIICKLISFLQFYTYILLF